MAGKEEDNGDGDEAEDSAGPGGAGGAGVGEGCGGACFGCRHLRQRDTFGLECSVLHLLQTQAGASLGEDSPLKVLNSACNAFSSLASLLSSDLGLLGWHGP